MLNLTDCRELRKLPGSIDHLTSLQELLLGGCESLVALPKFITRLRDYIWKAKYRDAHFSECFTYAEYLDHAEALNSGVSLNDPKEMSNVLRSSEVVVFSGRVNENTQRECSVVVSTKLSVTKEKLYALSDSKDYFLAY